MSSWIKYLIILLVCGVPLVFNPAYIDGYNLPKISLFYLLTTAIFALWLISGIKEGKIRFKIPALFFGALFLILANAVATVFSMNPLQSLWGQYMFHSFGLLPLATAFVFAFLICQLDIKNSVFNWVILAAVLSTIYGIGGAGESGRMNTTFGSPIYYSVFAAAVAPVALARFFERKNRPVWLIAIIILAAGLFIAGSRGAWIALGVSVAVFLFTALARKQLKAKQILTVLAGVAALGACLFLSSASFNKLRTTFNVNDFSNFSRHEGWKAGLDIIKEKPLLGAGPANFQLAFIRHKTLEYIRSVGPETLQGHAHNDIVQAAATTGLVGLAAYACFWIMLLAGAIKNTKNGLFETGILSGITAMLVFNQFNNGMVPEFMLFWLMAGWVGRQDKEAKVLELRVPRGGAAVLAVAIASLFLVYSLLKPFRAELKFVDGNIAAVSGDAKLAFSDFEEAIKINLLVTNYYSAIFDLGHQMALQARDPIFSRQIFDRLEKYAVMNARINRYDPDAQCNLGVVYAWEGQLTGADKMEHARQGFENSVNIDRYFLKGWLGLANIYYTQGNRARSAECFAKALEIDPQNQDALRNLANIRPQQ